MNRSNSSTKSRTKSRSRTKSNSRTKTKSMRAKPENQHLEPIIESQSGVDSQMFSRNKKNQQFVFIVNAHGSIRPNLLKINTHDTRYYDLGTEMHVLMSSGDYSDFAKNTTSDAVQFIKQHRGISSNDVIHKFTKNVDDSVPEAYVFDRDLHMYPFETATHIKRSSPHIFSVGVYEVNPDIHQNLLFGGLSRYKELSVQTKDELVKIANDIDRYYNSYYNRILSISYVASIIAFVLQPIPRTVRDQISAMGVALYKYFSKHYITSNAFKELTKNSVIPIVKEDYTMGEIISELRKIPKYKKGVHHIIVNSCFGGLTNSQHIEQVLKIQDNESRMNVDVHESFYVDAKKIYDLSSDNQHLPIESAIYKLLEMIKVEKSNIETETPVQTHTPFYKRVLCFFKPETKTKKCALYQNNVSIETIVAVCNITKLWLQILEHDPTYLDKRHKNYVTSYNAKYMCSHTIDRAQIDNILRGPTSIPVAVKIPDATDVFLDKFKTSQPEQLRTIIEQIIKRCVFFNGSFDKDMHDLLDEILWYFSVDIQIWHDWIEYNIIFSRDYHELTPAELTRVVDKLGTDENKETLRIMASPDYVDIEAKTFVENELDLGPAQLEETYLHKKTENFDSVFYQLFHLLKYKFDTIPIIYHFPGADDDDLGEEYWKSLLTEPLFMILGRMVHRLNQMGKFHYISARNL